MLHLFWPLLLLVSDLLVPISIQTLPLFSSSESRAGLQHRADPLLRARPRIIWKNPSLLMLSCLQPFLQRWEKPLYFPWPALLMASTDDGLEVNVGISVYSHRIYRHRIYRFKRAPHAAIGKGYLSGICGKCWTWRNYCSLNDWQLPLLSTPTSFLSTQLWRARGTLLLLSEMLEIRWSPFKSSLCTQILFSVWGISHLNSRWRAICYFK